MTWDLLTSAQNKPRTYTYCCKSKFKLWLTSHSFLETALYHLSLHVILIPWENQPGQSLANLQLRTAPAMPQMRQAVFRFRRYFRSLFSFFIRYPSSANIPAFNGMPSMFTTRHRNICRTTFTKASFRSGRRTFSPDSHLLRTHKPQSSTR